MHVESIEEGGPDLEGLKGSYAGGGWEGRKVVKEGLEG